MTIGSPRRFFSASWGRVTGRRSLAGGPVGAWVGVAGAADMTIRSLVATWWLAPSAEEGRHLAVDGDDAVLRVHVDDAGLVVLDLHAVVLRVGDDDDRVAV